jgi:MATE family multidrug resistance protein
MIIVLICVPINVLLQYLLCWNEATSLGFIGAAIATSATYCCLPILMCLYIAYVQGYERWGGFRVHYKLVKTFLRLGSHGVLAVCSEWWVFEIISLLSGLLGMEALAAQTIVLSTTSLNYMIPLGFSIAASTRV